MVAVSVLRRNAILPLAAYASYVGVFPLQCPAAQAMLAIPGFPCVTYPRPILSRTASFLRGEIFAVSRRQKRHCRRGSLHSCECWLLLVYEYFSFKISGINDKVILLKFDHVLFVSLLHCWLCVYLFLFQLIFRVIVYIGNGASNRLWNSGV